MSVVLHALGLSYGNVSRVLEGLKVGVVKATVWNPPVGGCSRRRRRFSPNGRGGRGR